jgi:hypothetical protein
MPSFAPFTLRVVDANGNQIFTQTVPFEFELTVTQIMERAFVLSQTAANHDPLPFQLQYYGYSEDPQFPGYLGYEVESLCNIASNPANGYWELLIDQQVSNEGADSMRPRAGAEILWQFVPAARGGEPRSARGRVIHERRAQRKSV